MVNNGTIKNPEESYKVIRESLIDAKKKVYTVVNTAMVQAYWEIGQEIYKACGENDRAGYGKKLLDYLSEQLTKEFGKGFTIANLKNMRQFYRTFPIRQTLSSELSWSHYTLLMRIEDEKSRKFYTDECIKANWSVRQQKITFDGRHFFIDLVFYNYILKCFVIIDLKLGDLTHQDLGQMQMYVNYYTREMMNDGDNPPIGIVLCADKSDQIVKYTLPENNNQIFASKYKLYMPTEDEFKKALDLDNYFKKDDK